MTWPGIIIALLLRASAAAQVIGEGDTTADYGGDANFRCELGNQSGVLQVTWQRLTQDQSQENLASYSKKFGRQVSDPYVDKVIFSAVSLNSTSMTVKNLTWGDESCYVCSFNVFPGGTKRRETCLAVQGISLVTTDMQVPDSGPKGEVVLSCSATGKPAPTIEWDIPAGATLVGQTHMTTVRNQDQTITSSGNVTLHLPPGWDGYADCLLNQGAAGQRRERFSLLVGGEEAPDEGSGISPFGIIACMFISLIVLSGIVAAVIWKKKRLNRFNQVPTDMNLQPLSKCFLAF
ncbi:OX-2 membrane glycoprotein-like [Aulostomus maculatus]